MRPTNYVTQDSAESTVNFLFFREQSLQVHQANVRTLLERFERRLAGWIAVGSDDGSVGIPFDQLTSFTQTYRTALFKMFN